MCSKGIAQRRDRNVAVLRNLTSRNKHNSHPRAGSGPYAASGSAASIAATPAAAGIPSAHFHTGCPGPRHPNETSLVALYLLISMTGSQVGTPLGCFEGCFICLCLSMFSACLPWFADTRNLDCGPYYTANSQWSFRTQSPHHFSTWACGESSSRLQDHSALSNVSHKQMLSPLGRGAGALFEDS